MTETANYAIENSYLNYFILSFAEKGVLVNFTILAFLWLSRDPGFAPGWANLFADG